MIMKISYYTPDGFYYYVPDEYAEQIEAWRIEFSDFLQSIEGKHPFTEYMEYINFDDELEYGVFIRSYGGDDFMDWINVEKLKCRGSIAFLHHQTIQRWESGSIFDSDGSLKIKSPASLCSLHMRRGFVISFYPMKDKVY